MTKTASTAPADRRTLSVRTGASRKLLQRKAAETSAPDADGAALEESFPAAGDQASADTVGAAGAIDIGAQASILPEPIADDGQPNADAAPPAAPMPGPASLTAETPVEPASGSAQTAAATQPAAAPAWSSEDERQLQAMLARRKAAGFQRRGKDVSGQLIRVGDVAPNPGTVVATIVGIVAEHGPLSRGALIDLLAGAEFASGKAKPADRGWCNGYIQGAVRAANLSVSDDAGGIVGCEPSRDPAGSADQSATSMAGAAA